MENEFPAKNKRIAELTFLLKLPKLFHRLTTALVATNISFELSLMKQEYENLFADSTTQSLKSHHGSSNVPSCFWSFPFVWLQNWFTLISWCLDCRSNVSGWYWIPGMYSIRQLIELPKSVSKHCSCSQEVKQVIRSQMISSNGMVICLLLSAFYMEHLWSRLEQRNSTPRKQTESTSSTRIYYRGHLELHFVFREEEAQQCSFPFDPLHILFWELFLQVPRTRR